MPEIELAKPTNLSRTKVIDRLEENFKKEKAKRDEADKRNKDAKDEFRQFVLDHEDQVINYLVGNSSGGAVNWKAHLHSFEDTFREEDDGSAAYASKESKPTRLESDLEKFVRVLKMSNDETVEVAASADIYRLL